MCASTYGSMLVRVTSVGLVEPFAVRHSADQCDRGIDNEHTKQDHPTPEQPVRHPTGLQRQCAEHESEKAAAHITHEDLGGGPIPHEKAQRCRREHERGNPHVLARRRESAQERRTHADGDGFDASNAIDTIHEIREVEHPDEIQRRDCESDPSRIQHDTPLRSADGAPPTVASTHNAAAKCPTSRQRGATCRRSSTNPISATRAPPPHRLDTLGQSSRFVQAKCQESHHRRYHDCHAAPSRRGNRM